MTRLASLAIAAALLLPAAAAHADVQQWTEVGVKGDVTDDVSVSFDQHIRFDEDLSRLGSFMPELAVRYQPIKWFRVGLGYRLQYERDGSDEMRARHRFFADARTRRDAGPVRFEYRLKFQDQYRPDDADDRWRQSLRNRFDVSYRDLKPWFPSASVELHHGLAQDEAIFLDKIWVTVGAAHSRKKRDVEIFYRAELPQADAMDPTIHILGAAYHHDL